MVKRLVAGLAIVGWLAPQLMAETDPLPLNYDKALIVAVSLDWIGQPYSTVGTGFSANGIESNILVPGFSLGFSTQTVPDQHFSVLIDFYFKEYVYRADLGRAFPTQIETGKQTGTLATVMGITPRASYRFDLPVSPKAVIGLGFGLGFNFNIPVGALDGSTGIDVIGKYLFGAFKVPFLNLEFAPRFAASQAIEFSPQLQCYLPIYHIWDGENLPFSDRLQLNLGLATIIKL